jgi:exoribonuclease R
VFSIDPPTARDLDDALHVEPVPGSEGHWRVGVHIADVAHFIPPYSPLDYEAGLRSTSVYMVQRVVPMLPRTLCEDLCRCGVYAHCSLFVKFLELLIEVSFSDFRRCSHISVSCASFYAFLCAVCLFPFMPCVQVNNQAVPDSIIFVRSLNPGVDRLAFSIEFELDEQGRVVQQWAGRSIIRSRAKLAYPMVQQMIDGGFEPETCTAALHDGATWEQVGLSM